MTEMLDAVSSCDLTLINLCVWNKNNGGQGLYRSATGAPLPHRSEASEITSTVLAQQPDLIAQGRKFLADHPEEASRFEGLTDIRLCGAQDTAGADGDFAACEPAVAH